MKFGIFYEHQLPRPWDEGLEQKLFQDALTQVEHADRLGIDFAWEVEHHFLEEYSHSSAPEVFLAAASQRTKNIRLGHGIKLTPPNYNHPARVAEEVATLDLVSNGRVEFGTGESSARIELEGFRIDPAEKRAMWRETVEQICRMMSESPYPGFEGKYFSMPPRNVVPKPAQKPHPPLWVACSNRDTIHLAAQLGIGALTFAFVDPAEAKHWVDDYYTTFKNECVPIGKVVNPNVAMVTSFSVHHDEQEAVRRGAQGFDFFGYALGHYYAFGEHLPGSTDIWQAFLKSPAQAPELLNNRARGGIGTPDQVRAHLRQFADCGVDQVVFIQQGGKNQHEHIMESLDLFAAEVMPEFHAEEEERQRRKAEELAPYIEQAYARKEALMNGKSNGHEIPKVPAYGRAIAHGTAGRLATQEDKERVR
ncbi:MAG: LLM class flavin-dependent oxidoreductase [Hyphomicrobiales bacterium]